MSASISMEWPWIVILLLGAWHGLNPGMGWLFAAALGMQEGRGSAAWRALPPLALGHALSVGAALAVVLGLGIAVPPAVLKYGIAGLLAGYGGLRLVRARHPRWSGMRVGARDLTLWSFLMATAHGAGLMVLPFFMAGATREAYAGVPALSDPASAATVAGDALHSAHGMHGLEGPYAAHAEHLGVELLAGGAGSPEAAEALTAVLLHTGAYLVVTGALAVAVVSWLGLRLLRSLWVDLDRVWAVSLILTGLLTVAL